MDELAPELRVRLLPSATGEDKESNYATSFLINGSIAVDAGSVGFYGGVEAQGKIRHVLLTHSHADHTASLPILLENTYRVGRPSIKVYGSRETLGCLREDVFNDRIWPDLLREERVPTPFTEFCELQAERPVVLEGLRITPVEMNHVVRTFGFVFESATAAVVICGDTAPTERIWEVANRTPNLRTVFLETAFPDSQAELAEVSKHLTPSTFLGETEKVDVEGVRFVAFHLKPAYRAEIVAGHPARTDSRVEVGFPGSDFLF